MSRVPTCTELSTQPLPAPRAPRILRVTDKPGPSGKVLWEQPAPGANEQPDYKKVFQKRKGD